MLLHILNNVIKINAIKINMNMNMDMDVVNIRIKVFIVCILAIAGFTACRSGGDLSGTPTNVAINDNNQPAVTIPTISNPAANPFYSNGDSLNIIGMCMSDYVVKISKNDITLDQQICVDSRFQFNIQKNIDGVYSFLITQTSLSNLVSNPVSVVWIRKTSVSKPVIINPIANPFLSAASSITISGTCESGAIISLGGDGAGSTTCIASQYTFTLPKNQDGDYNIQVIQTDVANNTAASSFVWGKHELFVLPANPVLQVATTQAFIIGGGSGAYNSSLVTNNSGGTYNSTDRIYTTGILANVNDVISVSDSLGAVVQVNVSTVAGPPDHLQMLDESNNQIALAGNLLDIPMTVKVVDRYENGSANYPLYYHILSGDATAVGSPIKISDAFGNTTMNMNMGFSYIRNLIQVSPLSGILPDLANTLQTRLNFRETASSSNKGNVGPFYTVGKNPNSIVIVDFNGDGEPDVAALNAGDPSIGMLFGKGKGNFAQMNKIVGLCSQPNAISSGDFNGDSKLDLIVSCGSSDSYALQVFLGHSDGTFAAPINVALDIEENIPMALAVADFNGDGKLDVALTLSGNSKISVRLGNGDGTFQTPSLYSVGSVPMSIAIGDVNKDGKLDLIIANSDSDTISILINGDNGVFNPQITYSTDVMPVAVAVADFDGDTYPDIAVVSSVNNSVSIFMNNKVGGFDPCAVLSVGEGPTYATAKDLDGDGKMDLLVSGGTDNTLSVFYGKGDGSFDATPTISVSQTPNFISVYDINKDGVNDILILGSGDEKLQILAGQSGRRIGFKALVGNSPSACIAKNFDGDDNVELAVVNKIDKTVSVLKGSGNGLFTSMVDLDIGDNSSAIASADLRKLGKNDIIVTNTGLSQIKVFLSKGDGTFDSPSSFTTGSGPSALIIQDFNRDGFLDIAVVNTVSNNVSILLGNGDGTFGTKTDYPVAGGPTAIATADLNGDGNLDLIVANEGSDSISVLLGNGNGTFQIHVDYAVGSGPVALIASDFNKDGKIDVAVTNRNSGTVSVLLGVGNGSFGVVNDYTVGLTPLGLVSGDFSGDGNLDLAVANDANKIFTILWGSSNGQFNNSTTYSTNANAVGLCVGDFNGDRSVDLEILDGTNNSVQTWIGH